MPTNQGPGDYISVMIGLAGSRPDGDLLKVWGTGFDIVVLFIFGIFLSVKYGIDLFKYVPTRGALTLYLWAVAVCVVAGYYLLGFIGGRKRADDITSTLLEKLVRIYRRPR